MFTQDITDIKMSDAETTKNIYMKAASEQGKEINKEILFLIDRADAEDSIHSICIESGFNLRLHGNKRNERNEMYREKVDDEEVQVLYLTLKTNTFITGLDLGYNVITDDGAATLGNLLQETHALQLLILSYNDFGVKGTTEIAKGLQMNETLKVLKLDGNKCGVYGGMAIAGALQVNMTLEELNLNNTEQGTQSIVAFTTVLKANGSLKCLDLGRPLLHTQQEETTVHVAKMLEVNIRINEIHLSKHSMVNFGAERLMEHIADNIALLHVDLSCNRISRDGIKCIAKYLKGNPPLQILNLAYNRAEDDGALYLSDALASGNFSLLTLVLCSNTLTDKGLCALAKSLYSNATLRQLYIWGNSIEAAASQAFLELTQGVVPRLDVGDTDVRAYVVDDVPYLARVASPY